MVFSSKEVQACEEATERGAYDMSKSRILYMLVVGLLLAAIFHKMNYDFYRFLFLLIGVAILVDVVRCLGILLESVLSRFFRSR